MCSPREEGALLLLAPPELDGNFWTLTPNGVISVNIKASSSQLCPLPMKAPGGFAFLETDFGFVSGLDSNLSFKKWLRGSLG